MQLLTELTAPRETLKVPLNPQESAWVQSKHERSILQQRKNNLRPQLWKWRRVQMCSIQSSPPLLEFLYNHMVDCSGFVPWVVTKVRVRSACQCYVSYTFNEVPLLYSTIKHRYSRGWCQCAPCNHTRMLPSSLFWVWHSWDLSSLCCVNSVALHASF